jgi:hypothetical protein
VGITAGSRGRTGKKRPVTRDSEIMTSADQIMKLTHDSIPAYIMFYLAKILKKFARQGLPKFTLKHCRAAFSLARISWT